MTNREEQEMGEKVRLYTATDREGTVYRRWLTTREDALRWALRHVPFWTMLVDSTGRIVAER